MSSGYTYCVCRDCFDLTVSSDDTKPELCSLCQEAGCKEGAYQGMGVYSGSAYECQRDDAYGTFDETEH